MKKIGITPTSPTVAAADKENHQIGFNDSSDCEKLELIGNITEDQKENLTRLFGKAQRENQNKREKQRLESRQKVFLSQYEMETLVNLEKHENEM